MTFTRTYSPPSNPTTSLSPSHLSHPLSNPYPTSQSSPSSSFLSTSLIESSPTCSPPPTTSVLSSSFPIQSLSLPTSNAHHHISSSPIYSIQSPTPHSLPILPNTSSISSPTTSGLQLVVDFSPYSLPRSPPTSSPTTLSPSSSPISSPSSNQPVTQHPHQTHQMTLRSSTLSCRSANLFVVPSSSLNYLEHEPTTYKQASLYPEWNKAMIDEIDALLVTKTWSLVPRPPDANIIGNK